MKYKIKLKNKLNNKGQAFESFRLLIAFILALAILLIIFSMVNKANKESVIISTERFEEAITSASKSTGTSASIPFIIKDLMLKGNISRRRIASITNMDENCIYLDGGPGLVEGGLPGDLEIKKRYLKMDAYVYCNFNDSSINYPSNISNIVSMEIDPSCQRFCIIFLNKKPPSGTYS